MIELGNLLLEFGKYILLIPTLIIYIVRFLFEMVQIVPGIFGTITFVFLPFYIGIFVWKLVKG